MVDFKAKVGTELQIAQTKSRSEAANTENANSTNIQMVKPDERNKNMKGTELEKRSGNPFYEETPDEHFDKLCNSDMITANNETRKVKAELAKIYNDLVRTNPEAAEALEFPPLPTVPKGKKALRLTSYLNSLDQYRQVCEDLMRKVGEATVVDEVRQVGQAVDNVGQVLLNVGQANLAATLNLGEAMLNGLETVYNQIETNDEKILTAINKNGQAVIRTINKRTNEVIDVVKQEGKETRFQEKMDYINSQFKEDIRISRVHAHIDIKAGETQRTVETEGRKTRETVQKESQWHKDFQDPLGLFH